MLTNNTVKVTDILVECHDPKIFDKTINQLGAAALVQNADGGYEDVDGHYVMRVFGDTGYIEFAIKSQQYGRVVCTLDNLI